MTAPNRSRSDWAGLILDALPDAVLLVKDGAIVDCNESAAKAFESAGLVGSSIVNLLRDGEWGRLEQLDAQRAQGEPTPSACRLRFSRGDGTSMMADVRWRSLDGHGLLITARDVTALTRAEALMGRLAHLPSGMDGAGTLLDASEPIFAELGWKVAFTEVVPGGSITRRMIAPAGDPVGDYGRSLVGRVVGFEHTPVLAEILRTGEPLFLDNLPSAQKGPVGAAVALSDSMLRGGTAPSAWCPIRVSGRITHTLAVTGADITAHDFVAIQLFSARLAAALRLQALRLEMVHRERLAAVGEMAAVLAHEVRNPLGVMFTALGTLSRATPGDSQAWHPLLSILQEEAERLQRLVTDLLEFANPSTPVFESVALRPIVQDALHAAQHDASFAVAQPVVKLGAFDGLRVRTDRVLLRRVLVNILVNAFQHVIPAGTVEISAAASSSEVVLTIGNDGPCIPRELLGKVFEPFFTTKPRGTGLGLAIVRRICIDVGAHVDVEPREKGAAFTIALPSG